jgi:hypothetical protein
VNVGESAAARPFLFNTGIAGGLGQHPTLCDEDDMTIGEFLLKFPCKPV